MENIYELDEEKKSKYRKEFNKLKFTKNINFGRGPCLAVTVVGAFACGFMSALIEDGAKLNDLYSIVKDFSFLALAGFIILSIYLDICYFRWMKVKHNVEY